MGPNNAYLYFGPNRTRGFLVYGNGQEIQMANQIRQKKDSSTCVIASSRFLLFTLASRVGGNGDGAFFVLMFDWRRVAGD